MVEEVIGLTFEVPEIALKLIFVYTIDLIDVLLDLLLDPVKIELDL